MKCSSCGNQKHSLKESKSSLIEGMRWWLCSVCVSHSREPRFAVILAGRAKGPDHVTEFIKKKRYVGAEITAAELIA